MLFFLIKLFLSAALIATISSVARLYPRFGALIASLPLVSVLGMIWLWLEKPDPQIMATHASATFWYVLPSLPMFLLIPFLLTRGFSFWISLGCGCVLTIVLYMGTAWLTSKFELNL
ncbi:DUF3147 family protein [Gluconobacter wancherniae]|uniref:DUF3147 family protein n=1 Tax=Gluconobacter wancherniae TaxID=1307955 RepID=UPI001B8C70EA|nr:DUF3147 family protein [Gluconobacter wancherniae]MBS1095528.1 DUF3147 family protein [Gluconobacter wancherniae]